jgi:hypothetical protein
MGRVRFFVVPVLALSVMGWAARPASAQTKEARGSVVSVSDSSLTVKVADKDMKFAVDAKTVVGAPGAGRATRDAQGKGAPGIKLTSVVKTGSGVVVTYREAGGAMVATEIRSVPAAAAAASASASPAAGSSIANGKVKSVTAASLVITDNGKDMTFVIDKDTTVLAKGAGTATKAAGGNIAFTKLVGVGDSVSVSYAGTGPAMRATEVRIVVNASRAPTPAGR